jgi:hypothetical protein
VTDARFFLVERYTPLMDTASIEAASRRLDQAGDGATRHVCTVLIVGEEICLSVFEAPDDRAVEEINDRARFGHDRIVEVVWCGPPRPVS